METQRKKHTHNKAEILLVEDSLTQAEQIRHLLESQYYKVSVAQNGKQAMDWLSKHKPVLVISDIVMPVMNGFELCKKIKFNKNTEDIPVILLTRLVDPEEIIEGLTCGADSFITKPFNEKYLLSHIEKILSEGNETDHEKVPFSTQILLKGKKRFIQAEQQNVIKLMLDIYEGAILQNERLVQTQEELRLLNERLESLVEERTSDLSEEIKLSNQIANKLKKSEKKYRAIFENVQDLYYESSVDGKILDLSPSISILSNEQYRREDLIGKSMYEYYSEPGERQLLLSALQERGSVSDFEITLKNRDGSLIPCSISSKIIFDAQERPEKIVGSIRNIARRKLTEEALKQSELRFKQISEYSGEWIWEVDKNGLYIYSSPIVKEILGYEPEEIINKRYFYDFFHPEVREQLKQAALDVFARKESFSNFSNSNLRKDGREVILSTSGIPVLNSSGDLISYLGVDTDITEHMRAEEELIKAKEKAEDSDRLKSAFLHNISHEIRTPMNAIVGFSTLLGEPDVDIQSRQSYIEVILQSSNHLLAIITDIVDISNIEANLVKTVKSEISVNSTLKSLCNQFIPQANEKKIQLVCETLLSDSDAFVLTDSTKLTQILSNLISNALKFTDKGNIKVGIKLKNSFLEFSVSDTGIGIPEEYHKRIFDRFYQVQNTVSRIYEGTGLGLSISKAYVELLGGKIWVSSEPEKGSSFFFTIPYEKQIVETVSVKEKRAPEGFVFPEKKKILVAEDIDSNFKLIQYFLSGTNTDILRAVNGKEAVEKCLSAENIDLVLMDIKMPVMDGYTAARLIRETNSAIPIIAQTAYADDRETAIECGCSGFISKPFDKKGLLNVISEFI